MTESPFAQPGRVLSPAQLDALAHARAAETDDLRYAAISLLIPDHQRIEFEELIKIVLHDRKRGEQREKAAEKRRLRLMEEAQKEREDEKIAQLVSDDGMDELAEAFAAELFDTDRLDEIPEPEPLIDGFLYKAKFARIFGPPKSLKSFVALDMAGCVGTGLPWFGRRVTRASALYVVAEGVSGIPKRVRAWEAAHETRMTGVRWYPRAVQIGDPDDMRRLLAYVKRYRIELVIFDTQARCTTGKEENSTKEMGGIIQALDVLIAESGACTLLVHHSGVLGGRGRGSTAFDGAVDTELELRRDKDRTQVTVVSRFQKDVPEAPDLELQTREVGRSLVLEAPQRAPAAAATTPRTTQTQDTVLMLLTEYGKRGASVSSVTNDRPETNGKKPARQSTEKVIAALDEKRLIEPVPGAPSRYRICGKGHHRVNEIVHERKAAADEGQGDLFDQ